MVDDHEKYHYYSQDLEYPRSLQTVNYHSFLTPKISVKPPQQRKSTREYDKN